MNRYTGTNMTYITLDAIEGLYKCNDYVELYRIICGDIDKGYIEIVKSSSLNGKNPALHEKYRIIKDIEDNNNDIEELIYHTWEGFDISYYKSNIRKYK